MNVKLVYIVDDLEVVLAEDTLAKMDFFTFKNFNTQDDVIESDLYKDKLNDLSKTGKVCIQYSGFDIPVQSIDFYAALGGNPFSKEHEIDVWYGDRKVAPTEAELVSATREKLDTFEKVDSFREDCFDLFQSYDTMVYGFGALSRNRDACLEVLESFFDRLCQNEENHFFRRLILMKATDISVKKDSLDGKKI